MLRRLAEGARLVRRVHVPFDVDLHRLGIERRAVGEHHALVQRDRVGLAVVGLDRLGQPRLDLALHGPDDERVVQAVADEQVVDATEERRRLEAEGVEDGPDRDLAALRRRRLAVGGDCRGRRSPRRRGGAGGRWTTGHRRRRRLGGSSPRRCRRESLVASSSSSPPHDASTSTATSAILGRPRRHPARRASPDSVPLVTAPAVCRPRLPAFESHCNRNRSRSSRADLDDDLAEGAALAHDADRVGGLRQREAVADVRADHALRGTSRKAAEQSPCWPPGSITADMP